MERLKYKKKYFITDRTKFYFISIFCTYQDNEDDKKNYKDRRKRFYDWEINLI